MTSYLNNGYEVMKYFAKFEIFIPHSIIMRTFMAVRSQMPELDWGLFFYKMGCQNTPYKLGLSDFYNPTDEQHHRELGFIALSMIGIGGILYYLES